MTVDHHEEKTSCGRGGGVVDPLPQRHHRHHPQQQQQQRVTREESEGQAHQRPRPLWRVRRLVVHSDPTIHPIGRALNQDEVCCPALRTRPVHRYRRSVTPRVQVEVATTQAAAQARSCCCCCPAQQLLLPRRGAQSHSARW